MKKYILALTISIITLVLLRNTAKGRIATNHVKGFVVDAIIPDYINKEGTTLKERIKLPEGYHRVSYPEGSFQEYVRNYKIKPYGSPIINYDGSEYIAQNIHEAILEIPVPKNGLQQCADALMRIRAEYLWQKNRKNEIGFKFTSGHYCSWTKYAQGYRPKIKGNKVSFHKTAKPNHTKANFYRYLNLIYTYAGTLSLYNELTKVALKEVHIGDMLVKPGTPGHVVMIADEIENENGEKLYALIQGNTPAQSVCLLKNFEESKLSPWYGFITGEEVYVPGYYFEEAKFIRFKE